MPRISLDALLAAIDVVERAPGRWTAPHLDLDYRRIFGGQLLAQAIAVAAVSGEGKDVKSLSSWTVPTWRTRPRGRRRSRSGPG